MLRKALVELGVEIAIADCKSLVERHDIDQDGSLDFNEFLGLLMDNYKN